MTPDGRAAEALAASHLERHGLRVLERNYRTRFGEIDLIARERGTLVFVEVRMRRNPAFGGAAASITAAKRARLRRTAQSYLAGLAEVPPCRFDVVLVSGARGDDLQWLRDAWQ